MKTVAAAALWLMVATPALAELPDGFPIQVHPETEPGLAMELRRLPRVHRVTYAHSFGQTRCEVHVDLADFRAAPLPVLIISFTLPRYLADEETQDALEQIRDDIEKQVEAHRTGELVN